MITLLNTLAAAKESSNRAKAEYTNLLRVRYGVALADATLKKWWPLSD